MLRRIRMVLCLLLLLFAAAHAQEKPDWCLEYDDVVTLKCEPVKYLASRPDNSNCDLLDANGNVLAENYVGGVGYFYDGIAIAYNVELGGATAFIREDGELITDFMFRNGGWSWLRFFNEGLCSVCFDENELYGCINTDGEVVIEPKYKYLGDFSEGLALFCREYGAPYGYVNVRGEEVIPPQFIDVEPFHDGRARVMAEGGLYGYIDPSGEMVVPVQYADAGSFSEGLAWVENVDGSVGFIRPDGSYAIQPDYIDAFDFKNGIAPTAVGAGWIEEVFSGEAEEARLWGLIDARGEVVLPFRYDWIEVQRTANFPSEEAVYTAELGDAEYYFRIEDGRAIEVAGLKPGWKIAKEIQKDFDGKTVENRIPFVAEGQASEDGIGVDQHEIRLDMGDANLMQPLASVLEIAGGENCRIGYYYRESISMGNKLDMGAMMLFGRAADVQEKEYASKLGIDLQSMPIARDALVFVVPEDHPLDDLSMEQLKAIYSGEITHWNQLNAGWAGRIIAYQWFGKDWPQLELEALMQDVLLREEPMEFEEWEYGDVARNCDFRAVPGAIGFCMNSLLDTAFQGNVKVLLLDGVCPTAETIADGSYPAVVEIHAAYDSGDDDPNVQILLDWLISDTGTEMLEKAGYVPLKS